MAIYVLATGDVYQKVKEKSLIIKGKAIEQTDTWAIGGPFDDCARNYFENNNEWQCFDSAKEAREAASNL